MKIAITNPTTWPWMRRGAERFLNELAAYLGKRGHAVTVVSGKPGRKMVREDDGFTTVCYRRLWHPAMGKLGLLEFHAFFAPLLANLLRHRYDVVHCCTFIDTYAAILARRITGTPCVFWVNAIPPRIRYFRSLTLGGALFRHVIKNADEVIALSSYMQDYLSGRFGRPGLKIPVPVDTQRFKLSLARDHARPVILCAAALDDERKGGTLLMRAFNTLKTVRPEARLKVSSAVNQEAVSRLMGLVSPRWRDDVEFLGAGRVEDFPGLLGTASITVLPSMWEAFGMVILESMATGTPVVGTNDGAIPELIDDNGVGRLFDPGPTTSPEPTNLDGLVEAMLQGLDLSRRPETAAACRAHAERYSWSSIGPRFEGLYTGLAGMKMRKPAAVGA